MTRETERLDCRTPSLFLYVPYAGHGTADEVFSWDSVFFWLPSSQVDLHSGVVGIHVL